MTSPTEPALELVQDLYLTPTQKNMFIEIERPVRRREEQKMAQLPSPAMMALAQVAADQLQEWLPGYPTLIAGDGPAKVSFLDREEGRSIAHVAFVNQVFEVEFDDGCIKRYKVSVTVRDLDDGG